MQQTEALDLAKEGMSAFVNLSEQQRLAYRRLLELDPFLFSIAVCRFSDLVPRIHQPIAYLLGGRVHRLVWALQQPDLQSDVTAQIIAALDGYLWFDKDGAKRVGIPWRRPDCPVNLLEDFCSLIDIRMTRGLYKTSVGLGTMTCDITADPNITMLMWHAVDPKAHDMCAQMGSFILSPEYRFFWPDRIPDQPKLKITQSSIWLKGRTVPHKEPCVTASGIHSSQTGGHFNRFYSDDIVTEEMSDTEIENAVAAMNKKEGLAIRTPGTRVRDINQGTVYSDRDDHAKLAKQSGCVGIWLPVEICDEPVTLSNVMRVKGRLTVPEIWPRDAVERQKQKMFENRDTGGLKGLLNNYYLVANVNAGDYFTPGVLARQQFRRKIDGCSKEGHVHIPLLDENLLPTKGERGGTLYECFDERRMRKAIGVDPAVSTSKSADEWAVSLIGRADRHTFALKTESGFGWRSLIDACIGALLDEPNADLSIESGAIEILIQELMSRDPRFRAYEHRIRKISMGARSKADKIAGSLAARMAAGFHWFDSEDIDTQLQARNYHGSPTNADDRLDSQVIGIYALPDGGLLPDEDEMRRAAAEMERELSGRMLPGTDLPTFSHFFEGQL